MLDIAKALGTCLSKLRLLSKWTPRYLFDSVEPWNIHVVKSESFLLLSTFLSIYVNPQEFERGFEFVDVHLKASYSINKANFEVDKDCRVIAVKSGNRVFKLRNICGVKVLEERGEYLAALPLEAWRASVVDFCSKISVKGFYYCTQAFRSL